jgi:hypothetical protein
MTARSTVMITCPCCHGEKRLTLVEHDDDTGRTILTRPQCTHCMGNGEVPAPDTSETQETLPVIDVPSGLRKFELSREAKKDHLLSLRMAPDEVEKLLAELYG